MQNNDLQCQHKCSYLYLLNGVRVFLQFANLLDFNLLYGQLRGRASYSVSSVMSAIPHSECEIVGLPNVDLGCSFH